MANAFITASAVNKEALRVLHSQLAFLSTVDRQHDNKTEWGNGVKTGGSITITKPAKYEVRTGPNINAQDHENTSTTLTLAAATNQHGVDVVFSSADLTLSLDEFSDKFIKPAMARLAAKLESYAVRQAYPSIWSSVGTPGSTPNTYLVWAQAAQKLSEHMAPIDGNRYAYISPAAEAATVAALTTLFNPQSDMSRQYKDGKMGVAAGLKFNMGQLTPGHTCGTRTNTTPAIHSGTSTTQGGATIVMDGITTSLTVKAGDVFTVAGVYAVNEDGESNGQLFQFVVQADATAASMTVQPMYSTGKNKNMTKLPADGDLVTFLGAASTSYPQNLVYHKDFYTFATVDLEMPKGVDFASRQVLDNISMRIVRQYNINSDTFPCRIDILGNGVAQRPELGCRVWG